MQIGTFKGLGAGLTYATGVIEVENLGAEIKTQSEEGEQLASLCTLNKSVYYQHRYSHTEKLIV